MSHTVAVGQFEGPLGLLLELVEDGKLAVSQISVGRITSEYLERVRSLNVSITELSEFLQLGARLVFIKSLALLPGPDAAEQDRELEQLNLELAEYRRFQAAARELAGRTTRRTWPRPVTERLAPSDLPLPNLTLETLAEAFSRALRHAPATKPAAVIKPHLSLETVVRRLHGQLAGGFELDQVIEACRDRLEIVVTFLAVLELVRSGAARVIQTSQFEAIKVEAAHA